MKDLAEIAVLTLTIILFIAVVAAIFLLPRLVTRLKNRANFYIAAVYIAVLAILSCVCLLLPPKVLAESGNLHGNDSQLFIKKVEAGDMSAPDGYKKTERSFSPVGQNVLLTLCNYSADSIVKTKGRDAPDNGDGKIDVYCYTAKRPVIDGMEFTSSGREPEIVYEMPTVKVNGDADEAFTIYRFDDGYSAKQFLPQTAITNFVPGRSNTVVLLLPSGVVLGGSGSAFNAR